MSHAIDLDGLHERLFVLQQIALASKQYCELQGLTSQTLEDDIPFQDAWGWTKTLVSNYCIESAIKLRMVQDFCEKRSTKSDLRLLERQAMAGQTLGEVFEGSFALTIREASNKIVHATSAEVEFLQIDPSGGFTRYWDGRYMLRGKKDDKAWALSLDVRAWAAASMRYLHTLEQSEHLAYLGQDFA